MASILNLSEKKVRRVTALFAAGLILGLSGGCGPELPVDDVEDFTLGEGSIDYYHRVRTLNVHIAVSALEGVDSVTAEFTDPLDSTFVLALNDSALSGDILAGDGIWALSYVYGTRLDSAEGDFSASIVVTDSLGRKSSPVRLETYFSALNLPPVIVSVDMPDSAAIPAADISLITLKAWADDPDGIADIQSLRYEVFNLSDSTWISNPAFVLLDMDPDIANNNTEQDGYFTSTVAIYPTNRPVMNYFRYIAADFSGNESEALVDSIQLYYPSGMGSGSDLSGSTPFILEFPVPDHKSPVEEIL